MAQDRVDGMGAVLDSDLLAAIRRTELLVVLRLGEFDHRGGAMDGECPLVFVASGEPAGFSDTVLH